MNRQRPIPGISRGPQQFAPDTRGPIQSPLSMGQPAPMQQPYFFQAPEPSIADELAMEIYARLAFEHIQGNLATDSETLQELAKASRAAAQAYFEGQTNG